MNNGAISFDKVEVRFKLDATNNPEGVYFKESKDANKLIEEVKRVSKNDSNIYFLNCMDLRASLLRKSSWFFHLLHPRF